MRVTANQSARLNRLLQQLFAAQARDAMSKVSLDHGAPDMAAWTRIMADAAKPIMLQLHQQGMVQATARIAAKVSDEPVDVVRPVDDGHRTYRPGNDSIFGVKSLAGRSSTFPHGGTPDRPILFLKGNRRLVCKAAGGAKRLVSDVDLFSPRVLDAVDAATFAFCRETMATATTDLAAALDQLRLLMREGLPRGDAIQLLAKKVREVFADPARAFRIATTETSRAMHGGQRFAGVESGVVTGWTWLASSDACELCLSLDGKTVGLNEPYTVVAGKPPYNVVWHPPAHPHCHCDETESII